MSPLLLWLELLLGNLMWMILEAVLLIHRRLHLWLVVEWSSTSAISWSSSSSCSSSSLPSESGSTPVVHLLESTVLAESMFCLHPKGMSHQSSLGGSKPHSCHRWANYTCYCTDLATFPFTLERHNQVGSRSSCSRRESTRGQGSLGRQIDL